MQFPVLRGWGQTLFDQFNVVSAATVYMLPLLLEETHRTFEGTTRRPFNHEPIETQHSYDMVF